MFSLVLDEIFAQAPANFVFLCLLSTLAAIFGYFVYHCIMRRQKRSIHLYSRIYVLFYTATITFLAISYFFSFKDLASMMPGNTLSYAIPTLIIIISALIILAIGCIHIFLFIASPGISIKIGLLWHTLVGIFTIALPIGFSLYVSIQYHTVFYDSFIENVHNKNYLVDFIFMLCGLCAGVPYLRKSRACLLDESSFRLA